LIISSICYQILLKVVDFLRHSPTAALPSMSQWTAFYREGASFNSGWPLCGTGMAARTR